MFYGLGAMSPLDRSGSCVQSSPESTMLKDLVDS